VEHYSAGKRLMRPLAYAVLLLLFAAGAARAQGKDSVIVSVADSGGRPLKRACITIIPKEGDILFGKADPKGKLRVKGLKPGTYRIVVKMDGYEARKKIVVVDHSEEAVAFSLVPSPLR
jgi:hypothetical protein